MLKLIETESKDFNVGVSTRILYGLVEQLVAQRTVNPWPMALGVRIPPNPGGRHRSSVRF